MTSSDNGPFEQTTQSAQPVAGGPEPVAQAEATQSAQPVAGGPEPVAQAEATGDTAEASGQKAQHAKRSTFWRELPFLILIALVLALLIKTFLVQAFYIPSSSMENTLQGGPPDKNYDRVLVNKLVYRIRDIHRGEIVVFRGPKSWQDNPEFTASTPSNPVSQFFHDIGSAIGVAAPSDKDFIKRVIGVGGDHVVCCAPDGKITVNGHEITEPYIYPGAKPSDTPFDVVVPKGRLWVMGDNRGGSLDSRGHMSDHDGTVPAKDVIGKAFVVVWPPSDWKTLPTPSTFHQKGLAAAAGPAAPLALGFAGAVPLTVVRRRRRNRRRLAADVRSERAGQ